MSLSCIYADDCSEFSFNLRPDEKEKKKPEQKSAVLDSARAIRLKIAWKVYSETIPVPTWPSAESPSKAILK